MEVFAFGTIIGQHSHLSGQFCVIGHHCAAIAQCPEVFSGIEAEGCGFAPCSRFAFSAGGSMSLGGIFEHDETVVRCPVGEFGGSGGTAVEMDGHHGTRSGGEHCLRCFGGEEGAAVNIGRHRYKAGTDYSFGCGDEGHVGHNHFAPGRPVVEPAHGLKGEGEGIQTVAHSHTMGHTDVGGKFSFKGFRFGTQQIVSAADDTQGSF